jgi:hypothetical protein
VYSLGRILALVIASAATADASIVIPFSGSGASGTIAPGQSWAINQLSTFNWGTPGVGLGFDTWNGGVSVEDFTITFTGLPVGVQITNLELGPTCGTGSETVFCTAAGALEPWTPVLTNNGATITFTAPAPKELVAGESCYINIYFNGDPGSTVSFTGGWSQVPEPFSVCITGFGLLAVAIRRRRGRQTRRD